MGWLPEAAAQFKATMEVNPRFVPSWQGLGQLYLQLRRFEDARAVAERLKAL